MAMDDKQALMSVTHWNLANHTIYESVNQIGYGFNYSTGKFAVNPLKIRNDYAYIAGMIVGQRCWSYLSIIDKIDDIVCDFEVVLKPAD